MDLAVAHAEVGGLTKVELNWCGDFDSIGLQSSCELFAMLENYFSRRLVCVNQQDDVNTQSLATAGVGVKRHITADRIHRHRSNRC